MPPLVLASSSRYRRALLARLGLPFAWEAPEIDEEASERSALPPRAIAEQLAERKARAVAARHPQAVVIGSDQLAHLDGELLGKPGSAAAAEQQLARLAGREHELVTAVCVLHPQGAERATVVARLRMRALDAASIARYVAADQPLDCAGSYKLEQRGIALFERIACEDHTAIVGLPLLWLSGTLIRLGFPLP
ncbi:MAG: nucleoside triphosphate pyrophosphatase [Planctomycetota bacterium]|nr:Maf family protein [Planctomycetota bacterium]MCX8038958.1 Maf family protein [Planctomycetota bacterium]MDW8372676.1 nucleoside triphosphate pyrophosphatase [Planctomycetota bacterium]